MSIRDTFFIDNFKFLRFVPLFDEHGEKMYAAQTAFDALVQNFNSKPRDILEEIKKEKWYEEYENCTAVIKRTLE